MITIGQELYLVGNSRNRYTQIVKVKSIGRKWFTLESGERVNLETLAVDGGKFASPAKLYLSEKDYFDESKLCLEWTKFRNSIWLKSTYPSDMSLDKIQQARELLGLH